MDKSQKDIKIALNHMKRFKRHSALLVILKDLPSRLAKKFNSIINSSLLTRVWGNRYSHTLLVGIQNPHVEKVGDQ